LEVLRNELHLYGTRETCGIGMCGACTVLVNGNPLSACLLLAPQIDGQEVLTIEGLSRDGQLHPSSKLSSIITLSVQLLHSRDDPGNESAIRRNASPDVDQIKEYLSGNLCRCGSYIAIIAAVQDASAAWHRVESLIDYLERRWRRLNLVMYT